MKTIEFTTTPEVHAQLELIAAERGLTLEELMAEAVELVVDKHNGQKWLKQALEDMAHHSPAGDHGEERWGSAIRRMDRDFTDFTLAGYEPAPGFRLVKEVGKNTVWLMADQSTGRAGPAYLIRWWFPQPDVVRLRVWRTISSFHNDKIGELPRLFVAQLLERYDVRLLPTNNAFWRGLGYWAVESCHLVTAGPKREDRIFNDEKLVHEFYHRKRLMTIHRKAGDPFFNSMLPTLRKLADS